MDNPVTLKEEIFIGLLTTLVGNPEITKEAQRTLTQEDGRAYIINVATDLTERAMKAMEKL